MYLIPIAGAILALLGLAWFFGHSWPFLNQSSHQQLYTARLRRAYLGASNESRMSGSPEAGLTENQAGDDLSMADYWRGSLGGPIAKGAPLHLINVTVNETVDGESQVQQQDRKGMGMALGPAAISLGVRHHVVWRDAPATRPSSYPPVEMVLPALAPDTPHLVFGGAVRDHAFSGEHLPLSNWVSISGAAFSTGIGSRTSLGLSLLCGFGNIRLGYWWNSGVPRRPGVQRRPGWISRGFPVQYYLLQEFIARFPGTAHQHWYLSDGGHFENMGGYELVRRRLPIMIIVDAEADPDYRFEGLANFIRKARLDFDAEIRFLTDEELDGLLGAWYDDTCRKETRDLRRQFGSLDLLRRGRWTKDAIRDPYDPAGNERRRLEEPVARTLLSVAHAALARVSYDGSKTPQSWLVYVKPTLGGNEPADLLQYHADKPDFPHETTSDQFFDEAQWESYRRLGEHIAAAVFGLPADVLPQLPERADERRELADVLLMRRPESA